MRAARRPNFIRLLSALGYAVVLLSCGGGDSTGPGGNSHVVVAPATESLALGASATLTASLVDGSGHPVSGASIFWSSENTSIATVSGTGVVTAIATGTVRIAASSSGISGFSTITVVPQSVASVRVTPPSAAIKVGETVHLQAEPLDASGNLLPGRTVTWSSGNDAVATVDNSGVVTGVSNGATTITATSEGKAGTAGIAVADAVASSITIAPTSVAITTGQTSQFTATVKDANGVVISGAPVAWSVDNGGVALVSSTGLVTGQSAGNATVTARSGAAQVTVPVTVTLPPANAVILSPSSVSLLVTQRQQMTANVTDAGGHTIPGATVTWMSSNPSVATIGSTGLVIANAPGTATITGTSGSASGTATVTVSLVPVRRVTVEPDALAFTQGDAPTQLTVQLLDSIGGVLSLAGRPVTWSSNNTSVATVSSTGLVTPVAPGQAVITVTANGTGFSATATVTVTPVPVSTVTVAPSLDTLVTGRQVQLAATLKDANGNTLTGRFVTWNGSNDAIAVVTSSGLVTAVSAGTVTITATSEGKTGAATIVVIVPPVNSVTIAPLTRTVAVGASTAAFTATLRDANNNILSGRVVTFASSDPSVATIDVTTGVATGVAAGTTQITASSEGKTSAPATLTVTAIPVASVTISGGASTVQAGSTTPAFTAVTKDGSGNVLTGRSVTFASSDPSVATINVTTGVATGVAPGTTNITATSEGKTSTAATLTVTAVPVASVAISPSTQSVVVGSTTPAFTAVTKDGSGNTLTGRVVTFASSNPAVATVNSSTGVATGVAAGTTSITASSEGKTSPAAPLTVTDVPVNNVVLAPTSTSVQVGSTTTFTATPRDASNNPLSGRTIVYSSSDPSIASINSSTGVALGVSVGSVTIGAVSEGKTATSTLTVTAVPVNNVVVSPPSQAVNVGSTVTFTAQPRDVSNNPLSGRVITWSSSDPTIASIDPGTGVATGVSSGTVTITATSEGKNGTASLTVNVVPVATVAVAPAIGFASVGNTTQLTATTKDAGGNVLTGRVVTWSSSDDTIATVNGTGLVTGVSPGGVTITATSEGQNGSSVITVLP